jgi:hypothetical protein
MMVLTAFGQGANAEAFVDARDGAKLHSASGFSCPARIGLFERDAVGEADPQIGADFCSYSALSGVYGTITLIPLTGSYDAKASLAGSFFEQEGTGGRQVEEGMTSIRARRGAAPLAVYTRIYETAKLEELHYRVLFAGAQFSHWAVEATVEYAEPRDAPVEDQFLRAVYAAAASEIVPKP